MDRDSATEDFWSTKCLTLPKRKQQLSKTYKIKKKWKITQELVFLGVPSDWMLLDYDNPQYNG